MIKNIYSIRTLLTRVCHIAPITLNKVKSFLHNWFFLPTPMKPHHSNKMSLSPQIIQPMILSSFVHMWNRIPPSPTPLLPQSFLLTPPTRPHPPPPSPQPLSDLHMLVTEDNKVNQFVCTRILANLGAPYRLVENGEQAVAAVGEEAYDIVLMDCHMPVMDGLEAT